MKGQQGWTLVQLMVSLALASVLILLFAQTWIYVLQASRQTAQLAQLQQSGQFVLNLLQHELRNSYFFAGDSGTVVNSPFAKVLGECDSGYDSGSFAVAGQPFAMLRFGRVGQAGTPDCLGYAMAESGYLQVKRLAGEPVERRALRANRVYLQQHEGGAALVTQASKELAAEGHFWAYLHQVFYLQTQVVSGRKCPVLMRKRLVRRLDGQLAMDAEAVINGVEAMVVEAGLDTNHDGIADTFTAGPSALVEGTNDTIVQIRFHLLLRSVEPDPAYTNNQLYQLGPRRFTAPSDHYRRLQLSSSVTFINQLSKEES